jgi:hypothetical protein
MPCYAGSMPYRGGVGLWRKSCSGVKAGCLRLPARSISHHRFCLRANDFSSAAGSMACRCMSPSPMATRPISDLQKRRCGSFIAPGLRTTISPRSRTGSTQAGRLSHRLSACRALSPPQPAVRLARYEDLRHLLKHKRRYAPDALTAAERRILARKTFTRAWMATGKRLYYATTRGLNLMDQEGRGTRFVHQAPAIAARLRAHPLVRCCRRCLSRSPRRHWALRFRGSECKGARASRLPWRRETGALAGR